MRAPLLRMLGANGEALMEIEMNLFPFVIGRGSDSALVLEDPKLSRSHARVEQRSDGFYLVDLESRNGCFDEGGNKISELKLGLGKNKFRFGRTWVEIEIFEELKQEATVVDLEPLPDPVSVIAPEPASDSVPESEPSPAAPRINRRPPPPLTITPIELTRRIELPRDALDRLRELAMHPKIAWGGFFVMGVFFAAIYDHALSGLVVDTVFYVLSVFIGAGVSTTLTWIFTKWYGRSYTIFELFSFYVFAYSVGIGMTETYGYLRFLLPEYSSLAAFIFSLSSLVSILIFFLNLRIIFDARKLVFRLLVGVFMGFWLLGTGAKVFMDTVRWRSISELESFKSTPYRYPSSVEVDTQRFLKELSESLEVFEEKSKKSFSKAE